MKQFTIIICFILFSISTLNLYADHDLIPFRMGNLWGFCDFNKKIIIKPMYDSVNVFVDGFAMVFKNQKCGFINNNNKVIIPIEYNRANDFKDGIVLLAKGNYFGYLNNKGKKITDFKFSYASSFFNGFAAASTNLIEGEWGIIDSSGKTIVDFKYDYAIVFANHDTSVFFVNQGDYYYSVMGNGTLVQTPYNQILGCGINIHSANENIIVENDKSLKGFINTRGKEIISLKYFRAFGFYNGFALVEKQNQAEIAYVNENGIELPIDKYVSGGFFNEGLAFVVKDTFLEGKPTLRYGYINEEGKIVIPTKFCIYDCTASSVRFNALILSITKYMGIFTETKNSNIQTLYNDAYDFHEGLARIWENKKAGYIDKNGKISIEPIYDAAGYFQEGLAPVKKNGKYGFIDKAGKVIIDFKYKEVDYFINGIARVVLHNKSGYIGLNGTEYFKN